MKTETEQLLGFVKLMEELKKLERFKDSVFWKEYPFPRRYESVADHTWRVAIMLVVIEKYLSQPIDVAKALKMALIHDIPEIIAGDASPLGTDGTGRDSHAYNAQKAQEKFEAEKKAARKIFDRLPPDQADEFYNLWLEFEAQISFEAKVVKALDRIEGKLQAFEYSGGNLFKEHMKFSLTYGVETYSVDPAIEKLGKLVGKELKTSLKEFVKR